MKRLLVASVLAVAVWGVGAAGTVAAQAAEVEYLEFRADITVRSDGSLLVRETTVVEFHAGRRGIIRSFPIRYRYDDTHDRVLEVELVGVTRAPDGGSPQPEPSHVSYEGSDIAVRIGDADRTITGVHRYEVEYVVRGAMNSFATHEELYWDITGSDGEGPFGQVAATVTGPVAITRAECYVGATGSRQTCRSEAPPPVPADGVGFSGQDLGDPATGGMTVVVGFPAGAVDVPPPILEERWSLTHAFSVTPATLGATGAVSAAVIAGLVFLLRRGRDRYSPLTAGPGPEAAPVQFRPPEGVAPAHLGLVKDERVDPVDVGATIVDLAVRGHLSIEDRRLPGAAKPTWVVARRHEGSDALRSFEQRLIDGLMDGGRDRVVLDELKGTFREDFVDVADLLYDDAVARQWFGRRPDKVRQRWVGAGIAAVLLSGAALIGLAEGTSWALVGVPPVLGAVGLLVGSRWMPARTHHGAQILAHARGFKRYLATAEAEEMEYATDQGVFLRFLPYAVAFGVVPAWARAFTGLDVAAVAKGSGWLHAPYVHDWNHFGSELGGFGASAGTALAQAPASSGSSGFSSGGGFSGGGFGGGGTSSW